MTSAYLKTTQSLAASVTTVVGTAILLLYPIPEAIAPTYIFLRLSFVS
jgi:hypothetical protein